MAAWSSSSSKGNLFSAQSVPSKGAIKQEYKQEFNQSSFHATPSAQNPFGKQFPTSKSSFRNEFWQPAVDSGVGGGGGRGVGSTSSSTLSTCRVVVQQALGGQVDAQRQVIQNLCSSDLVVLHLWQRAVSQCAALLKPDHSAIREAFLRSLRWSMTPAEYGEMMQMSGSLTMSSDGGDPCKYLCNLISNLVSAHSGHIAAVYAHLVPLFLPQYQSVNLDLDTSMNTSISVPDQVRTERGYIHI